MSWVHGKKVLVPIDYSTPSHEAVDTALDLVEEGGEVLALHVAPDLMVMEPGMVWEETTDVVREQKLTEAFDKEYDAPKYDRVRFQVAFGDAGHGIAEFAEQHKVDLIVMPSHGRTGMRRLLIGSVAERVVRLAHCAVLVLKAPTT